MNQYPQKPLCTIGFALLMFIQIDKCLLHAADVTVSNEAELATAIANANANAGDDSITFGGDIELAAGMTYVNKASGGLILLGEGHTLSRDSEAADFRIIGIAQGNVTIEDLVITGGVASGEDSAGQGGGIANGGILTLNRVTVTHNSAVSGGGVANNRIVIINDSTISHNQASDDGGGILTTRYFENITLTLTRSTVTQNSAADVAGGIFNYVGRVNISESQITQNTAGRNGAGYYQQGGEGTITHTQLSNNTATGDGGGGALRVTADLLVEDCTIINNTANSGGGIDSSNSNLTLIRTTVSNNAALGNDSEDPTAGSGAGINTYESEVVSLTDCVISNNTGTAFGGGMYLIQRTGFQLENTTFSENAADVGGGVYFGDDTTGEMTNSTLSNNTAEWGGGFFAGPGTDCTLTHCTLTGNYSRLGAGIYCDEGSGAPGTLTLNRNLISGNTATDAGSEIWCGTYTTNADSSNVFGQAGTTFTQAFEGFAPGADDINATSTGANANPTPLANILDTTLSDNGGHTPTHALVAGSPAIDITPMQAGYPTTDQRGVSRPQGDGVDAGAYEFGSEPEPEPESSASFAEYWHSATANTIGLRSWDLDPDGLLGEDSNHSLASGTLPRGLSFAGTSLSGVFADLGTHVFTVVSRSGTDEVRNHFRIQVIPPTLTPMILGLWINGAYQSTVVMQERGHGQAAVTELINIELTAGDPLVIEFEWDYIKDDSSFRIIRGRLPAGLSMTETEVNGFPTGVISGIPTETGEFIVVVSVLDWRGRGYQWIRLMVQ